MTARRSSAANPNDFAHPYLNSPPPLPKKREFGLYNLFLFKVCGCFSVDELPPPNMDAPIYQAGKSSSSNFTFNTNTTTTPTTSNTNSPAKDTRHSPTLSTSTNTNSRVSSFKPRVVGTTGVEDIPYRRPPQQAAQSVKQRPMSGNARYQFSDKWASQSQKGAMRQRVVTNRVSEVWESRAPVELAESDEVDTRKMVGNVSRLSAMFDQG